MNAKQGSIQMTNKAFLKIAGAVLLLMSLGACATISDMGSTVKDAAGKAGDVVKDIFTPSQKK